jgi:hypothetical protein
VYSTSCFCHRLRLGPAAARFALRTVDEDVPLGHFVACAIVVTVIFMPKINRMVAGGTSSTPVQMPAAVGSESSDAK